jgi:hypothetical protein
VVIENLVVELNRENPPAPRKRSTPRKRRAPARRQGRGTMLRFGMGQM